MANKINRTDLYPNTTPADDDFVLGTDVSNKANDANGEVVTFTISAIREPLQVKLSEGAFQDGDKTKLDGIEAGADVTDAANVAAAGALMDSEVANLADVKAFDPADYTTKTSATGSAVLPSGTTAQRDGSPSAGYSRFNSTTGSPECYDGSEWVSLDAKGALTPVAKYTVSSPVAALEFTLSSGFTAFEIRVVDMVPATSGAFLYMRTSADTGSTFDASADYDTAVMTALGVANNSNADTADNEIAISSTRSGLGITSGGLNSRIFLEGVSASERTAAQWSGNHQTTTGMAFHRGAARLLAEEITDAVQFIFSTGNITSGVVHVYGVLDGDA